MPENPRWKRRPPGSTWGDWGRDDQLGRLNLLTADKVLKGIAEVKEGKTFCLSLPLDYPGGTVVNPRRHPPRLIANQRNGMPYMTYPLSREDPRLIDVICDDIVEMTLQYSTQWDSLAHVGQLFDADGDGEPEIVFYNGYRAGEHIVGPMDYRQGRAVATGDHVGATALGVDNMAAHPIQGRAVMIDLEAHFGRGGKFVSFDELMRIMDQDKVTVEEGDLVCFRTGYDRVILGMNKNSRRGNARTISMCGARRPRRADLELDHSIGRGGIDLRQPRGRGLTVAALRGGSLRLPAVARALPVQARRLSRRDLVVVRTRRLAARPRPLPLFADRPTAAPARRRRLPRQRHRHGLVDEEVGFRFQPSGRQSDERHV